MRITTRITSSGSYWNPQWPKIDIHGVYPVVNGVETFDEAAFRRLARDCPQVQIGSNDWGAPIAFGALLIQTVNDWMDDNERVSDEKSARINARLSRRLNSDNVSFCRIDISAAKCYLHDKSRATTSLVRTPRVKITTTDNGIVQTEHFERDFAMLVADICKGYSDKFTARGEAPIVFTPETVAILDELHERTIADERHTSNERRFLCENYHNGSCSPCKFDCPHFGKGGVCVAI